MSQEQAAMQDNSQIYQAPFMGKARDLVFPKFSASMVCLKPVAKLVEDEPGLTRPDFSDQVSVQSIVDQNKDYCGIAYALRQINGGRLLPSQLFDDGKHGVDLSGVADNVNDAYRDAEKNLNDAQNVKDALGIQGNIDSKHIEEYINSVISQKLAAQAAIVAKEGDSK